MKPLTAPAGVPSPTHAGDLHPLAAVLLALRSTRDAGTACAIAASCAAKALDASEYRLLRLDPRSGALRLMDDDGVETPYLAAVDGPVDRVLRCETPHYDPGGPGPVADREALLWSCAPQALAALPLYAAHHLFGCLLLAFQVPRTFGAEDRVLLQAVADALGLALQRAELNRLLDEERERRLELEGRQQADEESSSHLMGLVAHEIRTPLTAIKAYTESLLDTLDHPQAPRERFLGIINEECDRLSRLVTDILDLSRLESGQRPLRIQRIGLRSLWQEILENLRPLVTV